MNEQKHFEDTLCGQAAQPAEMTSALRRQNRAMAALQETMLELTAQLELGPLLENIVARAGELTGTSAVYLDLVDPVDGEMKPQVARGALEDGAKYSNQPGEGMTGIVWQTARPLVVEDYDNWPKRMPGIRGGIGLVIGVPLLAGEQVLGVLGLGYAYGAAHMPAGEALEQLSQFARLAVIAIQNARLFTAQQQELAERKRTEAALVLQYQAMAALQETLFDLSVHRELDPLLENILARAGELAGTSSGFLDLVDPHSGQLRPRVAIGDLAESLNVMSQPGEGVAGIVWQTGRPLLINNYNDWPQRMPGITRGKIKSVIGVPLLSGTRGDQVLGVLGLGIPMHTALENGIERNFGSDTIDLLSHFARLAVIAIQNTDLFAALEQQLSERKRAEEALRKSTNELNSFFSVTLDLICIADMGGHFRMLNPAWENTLGYTTAELMQGTFLQFIHPEDLPGTIDVLRDLADQREVLGFTNRYRCKDGSYCWLEWRSFPQGELVYAAARDVTGRRDAQEALTHAAARSAALLRVADRLNAQLDPAAVLAAVCEETAAVLSKGARLVTVNVYDPDQDHLVFATGQNVPALFRERVQPVTRERMEEYLSRYGSPAFVRDIHLFKTPANVELADALKIETVVIARMAYANEWIGSLNVFTYQGEPPLSADEQALLQGLADQAAQALANARLFESSERRLRHTQAFHEIDTAILGSLDLNFILNMVLEQVVSQLRVDAADVLLLNPQSQQIEYAAGRGFRGRSADRSRTLVGQGYAGRVALERKPVHITNLREVSSGQGKLPISNSEGFTNYYGMPLVARGMVTGVLEIFNRSPLKINGEWLGLLETLSAHTAIAIDSTNLFTGLRRSSIELTLAFDATLEHWAQALDMHEHGTSGHTRRVVEQALRLARALNLKDAALMHLRRGAMLHDVGMMAVPDAILGKSDPLTPAEWEIVRRHPRLADEWLSAIEFLRPALEIPLAHHEKWDGTGYPRGLGGEQIPLAARIFAVVDVWEALNAARPHRPAWTRAAALAYMRAQAGLHFDPRVLDTFLSLGTE